MDTPASSSMQTLHEERRGEPAAADLVRDVPFGLVNADAGQAFG